MLLNGETDASLAAPCDGVTMRRIRQTGPPLRLFTLTLRYPMILRYLLLPWLAAGYLAAQIPVPVAGTPARPPSRNEEPMKGESRLIPRGDVELLTFETEADVQKLEERFAVSQNAKPQPGEYTMNYLRSRTDGSIQPYGFWVPRNYVPEGKFPLLIQLHGIGPKALTGRRLTWRGMGTKEWIDTTAPVVVAQPMGRGNTFYQGIGEEDVLEIVADVQKRCSIDPDRIFIMGHSMGGAGSWLVGLRHPDQFGSVTAIDAAMGFGDAVDNPAELPSWMQPQVALFRPDKYFPNARNVSVFLKNAGAGLQKASTKFSDGAVAEGGFGSTEIFPGMPHHFAPQLSYGVFMDAAVSRPISRQPAEVKFYTNTLRYNRAYWVTLDRLVRHNTDARLTATYDDGQPKAQPPGRPGRPQRAPEPARPASLSITTENIDAFTLRLAEAGVPAGVPLGLKVDGADLAGDTLPAVAHLVRTDGQWRMAAEPALAGKRHGMQGPVSDAFNSQFLAVYGADDLRLARAELDAIRNPPSRLMIHGEFPLKAATKLSATDAADYNLILFGTPKSNPVLARLAGKLPTALMRAVDDGAAVVFIYPNPENPARYVVVWSGPILSAKLDVKFDAGWMMPLNLLPDYLVAEEGKVVDAGHFDRDWK